MESRLSRGRRLAASLLVATLPLGVLAFGSGCGGAAPAASEMPPPKVTTMTVVAQQTIDADEYTGQTEASQVVEVRARVFGYLKTIDFKDGDFVAGPLRDENGKVILRPDGTLEREGQILFTIEPDEYEAIHNQAKARVALNDANLTLARAKLARNEPLVKTGAVSKDEYEESVAAVKSAEAAITAAQADANRTAVDLKYTVIRAPIDGRIDRAFVTEGNLLTGGQTSGTLLTKIVSESPMYVYFDVDERSLLRYMRMRAETRATKPGSLRELEIPVNLQLADEQDFMHQGTLDFVETEVSRTTGTARIRGVFKNENRELASGLFVRVQIPVSDPYEALLVPESALATDQSIKYVYVVGADGTAERRIVELGAQRGELRIITAGLQAGEHVIVKGLQRVKPGNKVEATLVEATLPPTAVRKPITDAPPADVAPELTPAKAQPTTEPQPVETPSPMQPRRTPQER